MPGILTPDELTPDTTEPIPATLDAKTAPMTKYARVNITKNSEGYSYETTVAVTWTDGDGLAALEELAADTDMLARVEIGERIYLDNHPDTGRITRDGTDADGPNGGNLYGLLDEIDRGMRGS